MSDLQSILTLEVPIVVVIGEREMPLKSVLNLIPGAIIDLPKTADEELDIRVNNKTIGTGIAVKVCENFGIQITFIGDARARIEALGATANAQVSNAEADALADALLARQL